MPVELEAKMKVPGLAPFRQKLADLGAQRFEDRLEVNTFFDRDDRSLLAADKGLRLRVTHDTATGREEAVITYKGPRQPGAFKNREELETSVGSPQTTTAIIRALGFVQTLSFEKRRESYHLDDCRVELDEIPHLGCFVEIEGSTEDAIRQIQRKLGLEHAPSVRESYADLLATWLREHGSPGDRIVLFPRDGQGKIQRA